MRRYALSGIVLALALPLAAADAAAQAFDGPTTPEPRVTAADSAQLLRAARSDQASFERFRRNRLPETWGGGSSRCDERIGRFCLTHGSGRGGWQVPPEHEDVVAARLTLVDGLNQVARLMPGDGWVAGQRVRYLMEAKQLEEALIAARECRAEGWWCAALAGFVHHYAARPQEADSAFAVALEAMEPAERDRWTDISLILDERSIRTYRRLDAEARADFAERFWRLSNPLLTRPGNELRSEHFARHVWDQFQFRAQSTDGISWGWDLREILLRYGWPAGWERTRNWSLTSGPAPLVSHFSSAPQYLLPPSAALLQETGTDGVWEETRETRVRTGYNVPLADSVARWFTPLPHQVAVFRRGEDAVVVAGYQLPPDSVAPDAHIDAGIALLATLDPLSEADVAFAEGAGVEGVVVGRTAARPTLMSLELVVPEEKRIARARYGLDLTPVAPGLLSLSDILLLHPPGDAPPDSLEAAVALARGSNRVRAEEQIGIYWEVYGLDVRETPELTFSLRLLEGRTGWLRRLAERAGLLREIAPIRLRWQEAAHDGPVMARSLAVQVPSVSAGTYTLELMLETVGREPLRIRKDIEVVGS